MFLDTPSGTNTLSASQARQVTPAPANLEGPVAAHDDATKAGDDVLGRGDLLKWSQSNIKLAGKSSINGGFCGKIIYNHIYIM